MYDDAAVALVEGLLRADRRFEPDPGVQAEATFALWLCLCSGDDELSLTWLVYDRVSDGAIAWCRVPDGVNPSDLVHARREAGDHTSPNAVVPWLERSQADPFGIETHPFGGERGGGDAVVLNVLRDKILER